MKPPMKPVSKSAKLANVCYDIRGPVMARARQLEDEGHRIIKLNIGNLAPFGFDAPDEVRQDVIANLPAASGYSDSKGLFAARKAIMHYTQVKRIAAHATRHQRSAIPTCWMNIACVQCPSAYWVGP